jgi:hypothetical protein
MRDVFIVISGSHGQLNEVEIAYESEDDAKKEASKIDKVAREWPGGFAKVKKIKVIQRHA